MGERDTKKSFFLAGLLTTLLLMGCSPTPVLKSEETEIPVCKELDLPASCFSGLVDEADKVTARNGSLDTQKLGIYSITTAYGDEDYKLRAKIVDKERPTLKQKKRRLVFKLSPNLDKINDTIRDNAVIMDNYDKEFQLFARLKRIPGSDKEVVFDVQVEDSNGNLSKKSGLFVQFTGDDREKSGLEQGYVSVEVSASMGKAAKKDIKRREKEKDNKKNERVSESKGADKTDIGIKAQQPEQSQAPFSMPGSQSSDKLKDVNPKPDPS